MIQKYLYGVPFDTESVVAPIPASQGEPPVGTVKTSESGFCFACPLAEGDRVYGLGEANRGINKRGFVYVSDNVDDGLHTENKQRMYAAHNFIVISGQQNLGLFFDYPARIRFDIGFTRRDWLEVTCERADLALYVITGDSACDVVKQFRAIIGRSYIPPKFAFGFGQSRYGYKTQADFEEVVAKHRQAHIPLDMVYMDIDYMDHYKDFTVNPENFPDFSGFVSKMKEQGVRLVPIVDAGVKVKIVTGDTPGTAKEIGRQIGLWHDHEDGDDSIITGPEFARLSDEELKERVGGLKIIARARPLDKKRLVEALQANGEVVAVTGDGTNDAPALKTAHVGLSMGDGTSVAKEASDITIINNSFSSIGRAVMWGRSLYQNIQRFLLFQLTVNVAACFLVLIGSFIGNESPLTVTQMLWVNLIMDTFGAMALASLPPAPDVMREKPRDRRAFILTRPMMAELLGVGIIFFAITLGFYCIFNAMDVTSMVQLFHAPAKAAPGMTAYEATLLFSIFVWTHFWYMFCTRCFETGKSIFSLKMSQGFWSIVAIIVIGQLFITEIAYDFFNCAPMLHTADWHWNGSGALDFVIIVGASSLVLWIRELYRLLLPSGR